MEGPPPLTPSRAVLRGLRRRCPLCGARGIFTSFFRQAERCPRCNYPTTRVDDQWIGSLGINTMVSFTLLAVAIGVGFAVTYPDPPVGALLAITVPFAAVFPVLFFPTSKSLWSAIDLAMRPVEPSDDVDPRWLPPTPHRER
jgi:uncharacterized protein (DUF983 family)